MKFKGKNKIDSTKELVNERIKYKLTGLFEGNSPIENNIVDFNFSERVYYGRVDTNYNSVFANEENLSYIDHSFDPIKSPKCVNFVADAFKAFMRKMDQAKLMNKFENDSFFQNLKVHKAYVNPLDLYESFVSEYIAVFNKRLEKDRITKYEIWLDELVKWHAKNGANFPLTFSGFQKSKKSNIFTSGLAISFSNESFADDTKKEELILNDKQMRFYLNAAKQYGFSVHQNTPWVIVADLNSPAMSLYTKKYDLSTVEGIFSENYELCYKQDIELLTDVLESNWLDYYNKNKKITLLDTKCNKTKVNKIHVNNNININNIYYIINYINIRNTEEYSRYTKPELDRIIKKAIFFEKKLDKSKSISYINEQFRVLSIKRPGTLNDKKNITRRKNDISNN